MNEFTDENGKSLPSGLVKYIQMPRQIASQGEAEQVEQNANVASSASTSAAGFNLFVQILLAGSLHNLWEMINGLQVVENLPLFHVKTPGNVSSFMEKFENLTDFDFFDLKKVTRSIMYFPEVDAHSINFLDAGIDSTYLIVLFGAFYYYLFGLLLLVAICYLLQLCAKRW